MALAAAVTATAQARDASGPIGPPEAREAQDRAPIIVTGTRLGSPDRISPNPLVTVSASELEHAGETNLTEVLASYPALVGSGTRGTLASAGVDSFIGSTGLNLLNLRNLGVDRTLVLVNGRRHVAALPGSAAVDINTIPDDLVERVDILTGGQSAIYGSDGVTGVVNFIMKRDFEGLNARAQTGISEQGDAGERLFSITAGRNFAGGRGNFAIAYEYGREERLNACDRRRLCGSGRRDFYRNPDDPDDDPSVPDYVPLADVRFFDSARGGAIDLDFDDVPDLLGDGGPFDGGAFVPPYYQIGGSGTRVADYDGDLIPSVTRHVVNGFFRYDASDAVRFFAEGKFAKVKSYSLNSPSFDFYNYLTVENPFMPEAVRQQVIPGLAEEYFGPGHPDGVLMNRDNFDLGRRGERIERETIRTVVGLEGDLGEHLGYSLSYTYGQTKVANRNIANQLTDRFYAAIDVVSDANGDPVCRIALEGDDYVPYPTYNFTREPLPAMTFAPSECVPLNIFGEGVASPEAIAFVTADTVDRAKLSQHVVSGHVHGDLGKLFRLPGGPVSFALGGEYRKEKSESVPDPLTQQGLTFANAIPPEGGAYQVTEFFGELRMPLLADRPWAEDVSVGAALRFSDYSTIGTTTTWDVNGLWRVDGGIALRGTYSESVRAPNIFELFAPAGQDFQAISDPCDRTRLNNGTSFRTANCAALLASLGVADPATFIDPNSTSVEGVLGGNAELSEETARTWTAGLVFQPDYISGLRLSLDWYDIRLEKAISTPAPEALAELCVDQPSLDNVFCETIGREEGSGRIVSFRSIPQNVSQFTTAGLDIDLDYVWRTTGAGDFHFRLVGSYLDKLEFIATPGAEIDSDRGEVRAPRYHANFDLTWSKGPLRINYGLSWFDKTQRFTLVERNGDPDIAAREYLNYKERWVHDIGARINVNSRFAFFAGVRNFTDEKPAFDSTYYPVSAVGRFFFAGVELAFADAFD